MSERRLEERLRRWHVEEADASPMPPSLLHAVDAVVTEVPRATFSLRPLTVLLIALLVLGAVVGGVAVGARILFPREVLSLGVPAVVLDRDGCHLEPEAPFTVPAGDLRLHAVNEAAVTLGFDLWRLDDDATIDDLVAHVGVEREAALRGAVGPGFPDFASGRITSGVVEAGATVETTGPVAPGTWAIVCMGHFEQLTGDPHAPADVAGPIIVQ